MPALLTVFYGTVQARIAVQMDAVEASALKLGLSKIPLWQHHRTDVSLTYEAQFENVMTLKEHGYVAEIGLSNVNAKMLRHAIKAGGRPEEGGMIYFEFIYRSRY